jgi:FkbM family methyltransferase
VPLPIRQVLARLGAAIGYEVYPRYMAPGRAHAQRLAELFALCGIERVLDVGANRGQYRDFLRFDLGWRGPIVSFEPDPELAEGLRARAAALGDANWTVQAIALGRDDGQATLNRMQLSVYNSFRAPRDDDPTADPNNSVVARFEVPVRRLDALRGELGDLSRSFVKLDTQGFDLEVLAGGPAAFAEIPLVQTEISFQAIYRDSPGWSDSMRAFEAAGFRFADLFTIGDSLRDGLPVEADCLFMRPR